MTYTLTHNATYKSLEISFTEKPSEAIRTALKNLKFRWHNKNKVWYGRAEENELLKALGEAPKTETKTPKTKIPEVKSTHSNKIRYYKAMFENGKKRFVEAWGEPLNIILPDGHALRCACEFVRGEGWRITDTASGLLVQANDIPNKKILATYSKDKNNTKQQLEKEMRING